MVLKKNTAKKTQHLIIKSYDKYILFHCFIIFNLIHTSFNSLRWEKSFSLASTKCSIEVFVNEFLTW